MKQLNVLIEMCDQCPHNIVDPSDWDIVCSRTYIVIKDLFTLPDWCPLEDAEDGND